MDLLLDLKYLYNKVKNPSLSKKYFYKDDAWRKQISLNENFIYTLETDLKIKLSTKNILCRNIFFEDYERDEITFLKKYLRPGSTFIDIGANIGLFSLYTSKIIGKDGRVISVEPSSKTFETLRENIQINKMENVSLFKNGISDKADRLLLKVSKDGYDAWNTFGQLNAGQDQVTEEVSVITLQELLHSQKISTHQIDLIKVDVEGWEVPVLEGCKEIFSSENNVVWMMEFNDNNAQAAGFSCKRQYELFTQMGYSLFTYNSEKNMLDEMPMLDHFSYINLIATKNPEQVNSVLQEHKR